MAEFTALDTEIQNEASAQPLLQAPGPGMKCIACVHDDDGEPLVTWYRACVLATPEREDSAVPVLCVDTGIKEEVDQDR